MLDYGTNGAVSEATLARLREIEAKVHRVCGAEPQCATRLLKACEAEERVCRGEATAPTAA